MRELIAVMIVGLGTYLTRAVLILSLADRELPDVVTVPLRFVAPAVLSALVVAMLIDGDGKLALGAPEVGALVIAGTLAYRTQSHVVTLVAGMTVYWLARAVF